MPLALTDKDRAILRGDEGAAAKMAINIIVRMAEVSGASELLDITGAHIDSTVYIGDAGLEFAERQASLGAKVAVPTSLNVSGLDEHHWQEWAVPPEWARQAQRQMEAYRSMGTTPTWTCAPYKWKTRHLSSFLRQGMPRQPNPHDRQATPGGHVIEGEVIGDAEYETRRWSSATGKPTTDAPTRQHRRTTTDSDG